MNKKPALKCHIVPTEQGNILLPDDLLVDVVTVDEPIIDHCVEWRTRKVPVFIASTLDQANLADRVAIIKTVVSDHSLPFFAIKVSGIPHSIYVSEEMMSDEEEGQVTVIAARLVRVGHLLCVIPDLPKIERYMREKVAACAT